MKSKYGYTVKKLLALEPDELSRMTEQQLKDANRVLRDAANKRLKRLRGDRYGSSSPSLKNLEKTIGSGQSAAAPDLSGLKGGERVNRLRNRNAALTTFLASPSSTLSGISKRRKEVKERMLADEIKYRKAKGASKKELEQIRKNFDPFGEKKNPDAAYLKEKRFWEAYRKYEEEHHLDKKGTQSKYSSDNVQRAMRTTVGARNWKADTILKKFEEEGEALYESEQERLASISEGESV